MIQMMMIQKMNLSEIILTILVGLTVFGPKKLPMLARHLGQLINRLNRYKQQASLLWQAFLKEQQLDENRKKARQADLSYQQNKDQSKT
jgi:sec-independent protein translocase protein TatB